MAICGVVLCGGHSGRMGSDKALLRPDVESRGDSRSWGGRACEILEAAGLPVVLSIRADQREAYAKYFPGRILIADDGALPGPLGALLSVYRDRRESLFALAADMPFLTVETLRFLLARFAEMSESRPAKADRNHAGRMRETRDAYGGVCFGDERRIDPLCAIYSVDALANLDALARRGLDRYDLQQLRELLGLQVLAPTPNQSAELRNLNSPEDLGANL